MLEYEIMEMVSKFHQNERFVRAMNPSFIVHIPKKENCLSLNNYRLISLVGYLYKIISKTLCLSASLFGRQIIDGVVIQNEVIDEAKKKKQSRVISKVDFEKTYDSVDCNF